MLKMVDGTGIIGVDMICPLGVSTPQPPNYDRVELEGAGMLVLPNSLDAPLERLELGGKTEQVQTSGKNLFDANQYEGATKNGVTVTVKDGVITATGTPNINTWIQVFVSRENYQKLFKPENKIYLKTNKSKDCNYDFGIYGSFGSPIIGTIREGNSGRVLPAELPRNDTDFYFFIDVKIGIELKGSIKPIVYHDGNGTWEPYTGCKPSPSPEYPQEIKNSGKWNEETQKYEVEVVLSGKNLFDFSTCEEGKVFEGSGNIISAANGLLTDFIPCFPNSQYSRSRTGSTVVAFYDCDKNKIGFEIVGNTTFVTPEKCRYFRFSAVKTVVDYTKIVACPGQTVMDYEPYREPKFFTLTSDRPLTKWDRLVEQGGDIGWLYNTDKYIVTGQESFETKPSYVMEETVDFAFMNNKQSGIRKAADNFCNRLTYVDSVWSKHDVGFGISGVEVHIRLPLEAIGASSSDESAVIKTKFSEYLKKKYDGGGPFVFYHKSKTTEFVPLQQSEQNAIRALKTYYPTTVITADGGELDPDIKVTYRKEI